MTGSDVASALARIEQALRTIEAAADAPRPAPDSVETAGLQADNARLRAQMQAAVTDLDRLLAGIN